MGRKDSLQPRQSKRKKKLSGGRSHFFLGAAVRDLASGGCKDSLKAVQDSDGFLGSKISGTLHAHTSRHAGITDSSEHDEA